MDKKVYVLGNNNEGQLGISNVTSTTSITEINIGENEPSIHSPGFSLKSPIASSNVI